MPCLQNKSHLLWHLTFIYFQVWHTVSAPIHLRPSADMKTTRGKCVEESQRCFCFTVCELVLDQLNRRSVWCLFRVGRPWDHLQELKEHKCATEVNSSPRIQQQKTFSCVKRVEQNKHVKCIMFYSLYLHSVFVLCEFCSEGTAQVFQSCLKWEEDHVWYVGEMMWECL